MKWKTSKLNGLCSKIGSGATPRGGNSTYKSSGISLIRSQNVYNGGFHRDGLAFIDEVQAQDLSNVEVQLNDILLNITGDSVARTCQVPENVLPARVNQHVAIIRPLASKVHHRFLRYILIEPVMQNWLLSLSGVGATRNALTKGMIEDLEIPLPPLPEQQAIADILGSLDDKIELNRKTNATLEAMARATFKSWFIDFDPIHAKSKGLKPEGMDAETAKLFPSSFEDSELGMVPKGWNVTPLTDVIDVNPSRKLPKGIMAPYLDMGALQTSSARTDNPIPRVFSSGSKFCNGDTLVARITPCLENGKTGYVDSLDDEQVGWGSTEFIVLSPKPPIPPPYAYFLARTDEFRAFAIANMTGTSGRQRVVVDSLAHFKLPVAPAIITKDFGVFASSVLVQIKANDAEILTLSSIRDSLLPKLLSGEITVPTSKAIQ